MAEGTFYKMTGNVFYGEYPLHFAVCLGRASAAKARAIRTLHPPWGSPVYCATRLDTLGRPLAQCGQLMRPNRQISWGDICCMTDASVFFRFSMSLTLPLSPSFFLFFFLYFLSLRLSLPNALPAIVSPPCRCAACIFWRSAPPDNSPSPPAHPPKVTIHLLSSAPLTCRSCYLAAGRSLRSFCHFASLPFRSSAMHRQRSCTAHSTCDAHTICPLHMPAAEAGSLRPVSPALAIV